MASAKRTVHTYDLRPLAKLETRVPGWGRPFLWEPTKRDGRACGINQGNARDSDVGHGHLNEDLHCTLETMEIL